VWSEKWKQKYKEVHKTLSYSPIELFLDMHLQSQNACIIHEPPLHSYDHISMQGHGDTIYFSFTISLTY